MKDDMEGVINIIQLKFLWLNNPLSILIDILNLFNKKS